MDLLCWMALASRALATIASSIGIAPDEVTLPLIHARKSTKLQTTNHHF